MLAITYSLKRKRIKVAKWGTPKKKYIKKKKSTMFEWASVNCPIVIGPTQVYF
jgi:hypothetical protein